MKKGQLLSLVLLFLTYFNAFSVTNSSLPYESLINEYRQLTPTSSRCKLFPYGRTDCGQPLQLFVIDHNSVFNPVRLHELGYIIVFINNGIHPGEPDGMDASLEFCKEILHNNKYYALTEKIVFCVIPAFNIDGALKRSCCSRVNQNGPEEYGFRGNDKNLDLNRDFMKQDSRNTSTLITILHQWNPDVFIDTHVSDGADYQYTMTLISSQHDKMSSVAGEFMKHKLTPEIFSRMASVKDEITTYVNTLDNAEVPDSGIVGFLETPRFASGYTSLFNTFAFITESHMLKPFDQRKKSTLHILECISETAFKYKDEILNIRKSASDADFKASYAYFNYKCDTGSFEKINFKGYTAVSEKSKITTHDRIRYDHAKPFVKPIPFFDHYFPTDSVRIPEFIYIPQAWEPIVKILDNNGVKFSRSQEDSTATVTAFVIDDYKTSPEPYEGHYVHSSIHCHTVTQTIKIRKGDIIIFPRQNSIRYLMEALTPFAGDSFFAWGFFDSILQQKEWFSDYVFEDLAEQILAENPELKKEYENWLSTHSGEDAYSQLYYIYKHSKYFEPEYRVYPVRFGY
ncbi:MAG: M14 family zinc carboxypeptidase [Bacteroidia bacterium]